MVGKTTKRKKPSGTIKTGKPRREGLPHKGANGVKRARETALDILVRVEAADSYADILLSKGLEGLKVEDKRLVTALVYGVLRWQLKVDWIIDCFSKIKTKRLEHRVLNALRLGVFQLLFLTRVPPHAAIDETVGHFSGERKKAGFVNAVLRMVDSGRGAITFPLLKKEPAKYVSVVFSHPEWLVKRWIGRYGVKEAIELCQAGLVEGPNSIRVNTLTHTRDGLKRELRAEGMEVRDSLYSEDGLIVTDTHGTLLDPKDRRYYITDEASQLVSRLCAPAPGDVVLDACAAPGGKSTHLAALMQGSGVVYAVDKHRARLSIVERAASRLGIEIIRTIRADSSTLELAPELPSVRVLHDTRPGAGPGKPRAKGQAIKLPADGFDCVLVDAPCSGLGVLRRTPDIKLKRTEEDISRVASLQKRLLFNLSRYVKKGGTLVYSVCTLEPEETCEVVKWFLEEKGGKGIDGGFVTDDASGYLPEACEPLITGEGYLRTLPHRHGIDGFFVVRFLRS